MSDKDTRHNVEGNFFVIIQHRVAKRKHLNAARITDIYTVTEIHQNASFEPASRWKACCYPQKCKMYKIGRNWTKLVDIHISLSCRLMENTSITLDWILEETPSEHEAEDSCCNIETNCLIHVLCPLQLIRFFYEIYALNMKFNDLESCKSSSVRWPAGWSGPRVYHHMLNPSSCVYSSRFFGLLTVTPFRSDPTTRWCRGVAGREEKCIVASC